MSPHDSAPDTSDGTKDIAALVVRIQRGDRDALGALYRAYYTPLWRLTLRLVQSSEGAEEILQDVFLALWRRRETLQPHDDIRAYLYASVRNRAMNYLDHERVVHTTTAAAMDDTLGARITASPFPLPDQAAANDDFLRAYRRALDTLTERDRTALFLRWEEELTFDQIAQVLGLSIVGARAVVLRAQAKLQNLLAPHRS